MPREIGIIFSSRSVDLILRNLKLETRRVVKPQWPADVCPSRHSQYPNYWIPYSRDGKLRNDLEGSKLNDCGITCRYGAAGDELWVKETWRVEDGETIYNADCLDEIGHKWKGSMLMPKVMSRVWLLNEEIRMERLLDIDHDGAIREGVVEIHERGLDTRYRYGEDGIICHTAQEAYLAEWDRLYAKSEFDQSRNPWVFVIRFRVKSLIRTNRRKDA